MDLHSRACNFAWWSLGAALSWKLEKRIPEYVASSGVAEGAASQTKAITRPGKYGSNSISQTLQTCAGTVTQYLQALETGTLLVTRQP